MQELLGSILGPTTEVPSGIPQSLHTNAEQYLEIGNGCFLALALPNQCTLTVGYCLRNATQMRQE